MVPALVNARPAIARVVSPILVATISCGVLAGPIEGSAQVVTPKTVPVLQDGQFQMYPSARAGMGGATIAVDDTLLDPFANPAKVTRARAGRVFTSPYFHAVTERRGGGRTLPVGGAGSWGEWSATGVFTFQQLDRAGPAWNLSTSDRSAFNRYLAGTIGRRLGRSTSVGLGVKLASLDAMDGVDLLYAGSDRIEQSGSLADIRLGLTRALSNGRQFDLVAVHSRTDMRHEVRFNTWAWDAIGRVGTPQTRTEVNEDRTNIWGLHGEYSLPIGREGWRLGWLGTVNRLSQPKIPNYVIQNIPRDPGTTYSFNGGVGIGRSIRGTSFAADLIYEPIFADTWADAATDTAVAGGGTIPAGKKTVENTFRFNNVKVRLGAGWETTPGRESGRSYGYQVGLGLRAINYKLEQTNNVQRTFRTQREDWIEWSPTLGLSTRSKDLEVAYNFSLTCGPGSCGGGGGMPVISSPDLQSGGGIIAAPSSQLFMQSGLLTVHKVTFSLPIR